jgi:hypothetical protein
MKKKKKKEKVCLVFLLTAAGARYEFELTEFAVPSNATALAGWGRFCWATDAPPDAWLLAASREAALRPRLQAHLWCVPRLSVAVPVTAVPVVIAALLEILIIVFCICKPLRARKKAKYLQI